MLDNFFSKSLPIIFLLLLLNHLLNASHIMSSPNQPANAHFQAIEQAKSNLSKARELELEGNKTEALTFFQNGLKNLNRQSNDNSSNKPKEGSIEKSDEEELLWIALAGREAKIKRNLSALGTLKEIEKKLLALISKYESKNNLTALKVSSENKNEMLSTFHRTLGLIYLKAPRLISIGSLSKAKMHINTAFDILPNHPANIVARMELLEVTRPDPNWLNEFKNLNTKFQSILALKDANKLAHSMELIDQKEWKKTISVMQNEIKESNP